MKNFQIVVAPVNKLCTYRHNVNPHCIYFLKGKNCIIKLAKMPNNIERFINI